MYRIKLRVGSGYYIVLPQLFSTISGADQYIEQECSTSALESTDFEVCQLITGYRSTLEPVNRENDVQLVDLIP